MMRFALVVVITFLLLGCDGLDQSANVARKSERYDVADSLRSDRTGGFARAYRRRDFEFPRDHLSHPDFKHEWWSINGNLSTRTGRKFGYQLSIFRIGMLADPTLRPTTNTLPNTRDMNISSPSRWRANHYYMAHFALTDVVSERFYSAQRFQRNALGLAGAIDKSIGGSGAQGMKLWVEDWVVDSIQNEIFPVRITAQNDNVRIKLSLNQGKKEVLNGDRGLALRGKKPGNASYYYSLPQMHTRGTINIDGEDYQVSGLSWIDREWSTSALANNLVGWDWFAIHLSSGQELMLYMLRDNNGNFSALSEGSFIGEDGQVTHLRSEDIVLEVKEEWVSPHTHVRYPASWEVRLPIQNLELNIVPYLADQELNLAVNYWEGAVRVSGRKLVGGDKSLDGQGYVELTGYQPIVRN